MNTLFRSTIMILIVSMSLLVTPATGAPRTQNNARTNTQASSRASTKPASAKPSATKPNSTKPSSAKPAASTRNSAKPQAARNGRTQTAVRQTAKPATTQIAATPKARDDATKNLEKIRQEIQMINRQLAEKRRQQKDVSDGLQQSERAISRANQNLVKIQHEYDGTQKSLEQMKAALSKTEKEIADKKTHMAQFFQHQYVNARRSNVKEMLTIHSWDKASQIKARHALAYVATAQKNQLVQLERMKEQQQQEIELREDALQSLGDIKTKEQEEQKALAQALQEKQQALHLISQQLNTHQSRLAMLKKDESRLGNVITQISRRIAAQEKERQRQQALAQKEAEKQRQIAREKELAARRLAANRGQPVTESMPASLEKPVMVESVKDDAYGSVAFEQLKGRLKYPVSGHLMNQFGATRQDSGTTWKGVFIQAGSGQPVKALAAGRVVFSDWMRGYGNMVIIDHGQGYLSIYGHNDSLTKSVGTAVKPGETVATVGNTGNLENYGLYFELRHQDRPIDPVKWMKR